MQSQCHTPPPSGRASVSNEEKAVKSRRTTYNEPSDAFLDQVKIIDEKMIDYLGKVRKDEAGKTEKDEAELFCNSLIPVLREMDKKQLQLAKLKIEQLLYDFFCKNISLPHVGFEFIIYFTKLPNDILYGHMKHLFSQK